MAYHAKEESERDQVAVVLGERVHAQKQRPDGQRPDDELFLTDALGERRAGPERNQVTSEEDGEEVVELVLFDVHILEDSHGTGLRERRLVEVYQKGDPPRLHQEEPKVLAHHLLGLVRLEGASGGLMLVVPERGVVDVTLRDVVEGATNLVFSVSLGLDVFGMAIVRAGVFHGLDNVGRSFGQTIFVVGHDINSVSKEYCSQKTLSS